MEIYYQQLRSDEISKIIDDIRDKKQYRNSTNVNRQCSITLNYGRSNSIDPKEIIDQLYGSNNNNNNIDDNNNNPTEKQLDFDDNVEIPQVNIDLGDDVIIGEISTPCNFYLIKNNPKIVATFKEFEEKLDQFYENEKHRFQLIDFNATSIENNRYGVAKNPVEPHRWSRIQVVNHSDQSSSQCFFLDHGLLTPINTEQIFKLDNRFKNYPARSFKAALSGVSPKSEFWSLAETSFFESISKDKELLIIPLNVIDNDRHECYLLDCEVDINTEIENFILGSCS